jgi:hypothetical protein
MKERWRGMRGEGEKVWTTKGSGVECEKKG